MAIDYEAIKQSLYIWVTSIVSPTWNVIFYQPNAPRPALPYLTLYISTLNQVGYDSIISPDNAGSSDIVGNREFTLTIQSYSQTEALNILETLRSSLQMPSVLAALRSNNIAFVDYNTINDISAILDTEWEKRGAIDLVFRIAQTVDDDVGLIETVEVDEEFETGSQTYTDTIQIPE